jgi:hypothetical protein
MTMVRIWSAQAAHLAWEQTSPASRPEQAVPAWDQPQRLPARGERPTSHVHQILGPRPAGSRTPLGGTPTATWTMTSATSATAPAGPAMAAPSQPARAASTPDHRGDVEALRRWDDGRRDRAGQRHPLLCTPAGIVRVALHPVHATIDSTTRWLTPAWPSVAGSCPMVARNARACVGSMVGVLVTSSTASPPTSATTSPRPRLQDPPDRAGEHNRIVSFWNAATVWRPANPVAPASAILTTAPPAPCLPMRVR